MDVQWGDDLHQIGGPGQNGADVLTWLGTLIGADSRRRSPPRVARALGAAAPCDAAALPSVSLGRARAVLGCGPARRLPRPVARARARRSRLGGARRHRVPQPHRARPRRDARPASRSTRCGSAAAPRASPPGRRSRPTCCERPVATVTAEEPGVLGAAIAAFVGLGTFETLSRGAATSGARRAPLRAAAAAA